MATLLKMTGITKSFFGIRVLNGVDFDLERGEVHVLLGENGAGKSTLMKILSGAYACDEGTLTLDDRTVDLASYDPKTAEDLGVVTVYQNFHLIPDLSVAENLSLTKFTRERGLIRWKDVYSHAAAVLNKIDFDIDLRAKVRDLPVSQKQMLEIAIALSKNAKVLVMDEPTAALSRKEIETLFKTIADIKSQGIGIIYISHKLEEVKQIGDRITVLRDGLNVATLAAAEANIQQIIGLMIGKDLTRSADLRDVPPGDEIIRVDGLQNRHFTAPLSFMVRKNEILGITGLVGAGKTELARALFGVDPVSAGTTQWSGQPVQIGSPRTAIGLGLGYLPEDRDADGLCLNLPVKDNISLVLLTKLKSIFFSVGQEQRTVAGLVDSIGIKTAGLTQQVKYLSGGNKQKVVFGKWLTARCNVLVLDEPTIGIDIGARNEIYGLIREFVNDTDHAVIFISSDMSEVLEIADRILVMSGGGLVAELDPKHTTKQEIMQYSMQGMSTLA